MATPLIAPRPGEGVEELTISNWLKKVGDEVKELEPIVEVETDKVVTEIPSPVSGTLLQIDVPAGNTVQVGNRMGVIGAPGESLEGQGSAAESQPAPSAQAAANVPQEGIPARTETPVAKAVEASGFISPLVHKMAEENHLDLTKIPGTGEGGRITKADVNNYLNRQSSIPSQPVQTPAAAGPGVVGAVTPAAAPKPASVNPTAEGTLVPLSVTRKLIAERMLQSMQISPQVLTVMEADMTAVLAHRKVNKPLFAADGINLTLTAYFIAAIVEGLKTNPLLNASWTEQGVFEYKSINVGMAVAMGADGLIVPVIHDAQNLSLQGIAQKVNDLTVRARGKKLSPEDVRGGTFTLTNHGIGGSLFASPIINQPQLGILGTGVMQKRVVVLTDEAGNDTIAIRPMVYLSLVFDHRVIDGESGDAFLMKVKQILEQWS